MLINKRTGKIFIIKSPNTDDIYIGSTSNNQLSQIMATARYMFKQNCLTASYKSIIEAGDAYIELLEELENDDKQNLLVRRKYWLEKYKNKSVNTRTYPINEAERLQSYREKAKKYYYDKDKYFANKEKRLASYHQNKEKQREYAKKYYQENKAKIHLNQKKIKEVELRCPLCKSICYTTNLEKHQRGIKCLSKRNPTEITNQKVASLFGLSSLPPNLQEEEEVEGQEGSSGLH